ncbi:hypothetical protein BGX38DRAFT_1216512 [Terfezia claveryi]|nr:hypothetical protein BGX38DRAFT_1216512 [Terfezia claveryi]
MNSTLREISADITLFTRHLIANTDGLRIIEAHPRESIQYNISRRQLSPQHTIAYRDNNVRIWLHELITMTPWTNEAWQRMVFHERKVFDESLIKLMGILEARLSKCEQTVLEIHEIILKARGPLVRRGEKYGAQFGEPWLNWAWDGTIRMKGFVAQLERFKN